MYSLQRCFFCILRCLPALLLIVLVACTKGSGPPDHVLLDDSVGAWSAGRPTQVFAGEALYQHINGAADIYHEYGFEQVSVRDYRDGDSRMLTVEHYTMQDTDAAFGIFSALRPAGGEAVELGNSGALTDLQLLMYSGRDLLVVTAQDLGIERESLLGIAGVLAGRLPTDSARPALLSLLPTEPRVPGSERFLRGPIALGNLAPRLAPLFPSFAEAVAAHYQDGEVLKVVLLLNEEAAAVAAMTEASARAARITESDMLHSGDKRLCFTYPGGTALHARRDGRLIWVDLADHTWQLPGVAAERPGVVLEE